MGLENVWMAFHSVPDVAFPRTTSKPKLQLRQARPSSWRLLASAVQGELTLDVGEWKRHTVVELSEGSNITNSEARRITDWFWQVMEQFNQAERGQFFFWASAWRRW